MLRELLIHLSLDQIEHNISLTGRALDHRGVINDFVAKTRELRHLELSAEDWDSIALVTRWLKTFRSVTTQMSSTKHSMLSSTHAIFRGLQESICGFIKDLPHDASPHLRTALTNSHRKLSDYYYKFDESPYYVWAGSMCHSSQTLESDLLTTFW